MLEVRALEKRYPEGREVLKGLAFDLGPEDTLAVVGPSGCGKTTLLYLLCGLAAPDAGEVRLQGRKITSPTPDIAIILQDYGLLPWKTVQQNVSVGLKIQGAGKTARRAAARKVLADMGLKGRENDYPARLSGGEQQRVAIARAYAQSPKLLLMDEPFSSLDAITRETLQQTLLQSWRSQRIPYVLVTHSVEEAAFLGKRIMLLSGEPAEIRQVFDNPGFGESGYREQPEFYDLVRTVRTAMEKHW